ncbi:MAG: ribosome maturation factor RimM [Pseudomonadota bacterium]
MSDSSFIMKNGLLVIGKIVNTHGIQGKLKISSYAESPEVFISHEFFYIKDKNGDFKEYKITNVEPHKNSVLLKFNGISSISDAEKLVGSSIFIEKNKLDTLPEGEYYWFEIIGIEVFTDEGTFLGKVERILQTGSNDVYIVRNEEKEYLIPAIADVVTNIDVIKKVMIIHPLEGLFEDDEV